MLRFIAHHTIIVMASCLVMHHLRRWEISGSSCPLDRRFMKVRVWVLGCNRTWTSQAQGDYPKLVSQRRTTFVNKNRITNSKPYFYLWQNKLILYLTHSFYKEFDFETIFIKEGTRSSITPLLFVSVGTFATFMNLLSDGNCVKFMQMF